MAVRRVLVTGSRTWTNLLVIRDVLAEWWQPDAVLVSGACPLLVPVRRDGLPRGADWLCEQCWGHWGGRVERHPAEWGRFGRAAGPIRNEHMVSLGAAVCLAFIRNNSRGATHCAGLAERAGIVTRVYRDNR